MLTVVAAMGQEIGLAMRLCTSPSRLPVKGLLAWQAGRNGIALHLVRTGIGPARASAQIRKYLAAYRPSRILLTGYGGALDPVLGLGDIVAIRQASLFGTNCANGEPLDDMDLEGSWPLDGAEHLVRAAERAGIRAVAGDALTSPFLIGDPAQKRALRLRSGAAVIDMESAVIARAAAEAGIAVSCVRAITDRADHDFLAPFSYVPASGLRSRAVRFVVAGKWVSRYRTWRECSESAGRSLGTFLAEYLDLQTTRITPSLLSE